MGSKHSILPTSSTAKACGMSCGQVFWLPGHRFSPRLPKLALSGVYRGETRRLQRRDRAGFAPDFPVRSRPLRPGSPAHPWCSTIPRFLLLPRLRACPRNALVRKRHLETLSGLFRQVLELAQQAGASWATWPWMGRRSALRSIREMIALNQRAQSRLLVLRALDRREVRDFRYSVSETTFGGIPGCAFFSSEVRLPTPNWAAHCAAASLRGYNRSTAGRASSRLRTSSQT